MKRMNEVFELPVMVDSDGDIDVGTEDWIHLQNHNQANPIAHAINNVDKLADALELLLDGINSSMTGDSINNQVISASKALAAYRGAL